MTERLTTTVCHKCGGTMKPGIATGQTWKPGLPDFIGDKHASTFSAGGPGRVIEVMKCQDCGHSVKEITPPAGS